MKRNTDLLISLPHSEETEKAVIGALLIESGAIGEVVGILNADIFYDVALGKIYSAIASLYENNIKPDLLTVTKTLIRSGELEKVGGPFFRKYRLNSQYRGPCSIPASTLVST